MNHHQEQEKIWLAQYPDRVPPEIDRLPYDNLNDFFEEKCQQFTDGTAFINMGQSLTYNELEKQSRHFAAYLQFLGLEPGARVALMCVNVLQYPIAMFGILRAGMVVVNVNPRYKPQELQHQLCDCQAEVIVICDFSAHVLQAVLDKTNVRHVITTKIGDALPFPKSLLINFYLKYIAKKVPSYTLHQTVCFKQALAKGANLSLQKVKLSQEDLAFLQYTGGTTGVAKGAMLSHGNLLANIMQIIAWVGPNMDGEQFVVTALPLYHVFALTINCLTFLNYGATNLLITNPTDIPAFVSELEKYPFTVLVGINTLFNVLLHNHRFQKLDFSTLQLSFCGGMPTQEDVANRWQKITGKAIVEGYGLTEASPVISANPLTTTAFNGSIGMPLPSTEIQIRDKENNLVGLDTPGQLFVRGPQVMSGYWRMPDETAHALDENGWLSSGDVATLDAQGYLRIVDRIKDMILVSGFNVYPTEVEEVIMLMPEVEEVAVVGITHKETGEAVKAYVIKEVDDLSENEIKDFCRERLTGYKIPKYIEFRDFLPKSVVGKILRRELRDESKI